MRALPWSLCSALLAAPLAGTLGAFDGRDETQPAKPPEVGTIAPPLGPELYWIQFDAATGGKAPDIGELRGKVVVVTTYGYYCDSCVRFGVPAANALRQANPEDLRVISITLGVGGDTPESIREEAVKLDITHAVAQGDADGATTPYLNMGVSPSLTYAFVISRSGGVTWRGDPSRERDAYLAAVASALNAVPAAPLPSALAPELANAVRAYIEGNFVAAETAAQGVLKKLGSKSTAEAVRARTDGNALLALVAQTKKQLMEELERSVGDEQVERFQRALERVRRAFSKGECADRAGQLDMVMSLQRPHGPACRAWSEWFALEAARPATFPLEKDKAATKYAKELTKYAKQADAPGVERARAWLRDYELAPERK